MTAMKKNMQKISIQSEISEIFKLIGSTNNQEKNRDLLIKFLKEFTNLYIIDVENLIFIPKIALKFFKFAEEQGNSSISSILEARQQAELHFGPGNFTISLDLSDLESPYFVANYREEPRPGYDCQPAQYGPWGLTSR